MWRSRGRPVEKDPREAHDSLKCKQYMHWTNTPTNKYMVLTALAGGIIHSTKFPFMTPHYEGDPWGIVYDMGRFLPHTIEDAKPITKSRFDKWADLFWAAEKERIYIELAMKQQIEYPESVLNDHTKAVISHLTSDSHKFRFFPCVTQNGPSIMDDIWKITDEWFTQEWYLKVTLTYLFAPHCLALKSHIITHEPISYHVPGGGITIGQRTADIAEIAGMKYLQENIEEATYNIKSKREESVFTNCKVTDCGCHKHMQSYGEDGRWWVSDSM